MGCVAKYVSFERTIQALQMGLPGWTHVWKKEIEQGPELVQVVLNGRASEKQPKL